MFATIPSIINPWCWDVQCFVNNYSPILLQNAGMIFNVLSIIAPRCASLLSSFVQKLKEWQVKGIMKIARLWSPRVHFCRGWGEYHQGCLMTGVKKHICLTVILKLKLIVIQILMCILKRRQIVFSQSGTRLLHLDIPLMRGSSGASF